MSVEPGMPRLISRWRVVSDPRNTDSAWIQTPLQSANAPSGDGLNSG